MTSAAQRDETRPAEVEDVEVRLQRLAELLVHGASRVDLIDLAMRRWQVSQRTAEVYVQKVRERLTGEAASADQLFYLTLSQLQRDRLVSIALRYTMNEHFDPQVMQSLSAMITAVRGLLDSRDRTAAEIHQLVEEKINAAKTITVPAGEPPRVSERVHATASRNGTRSKGKRPSSPPLPPAIAERMNNAPATASISKEPNGLEHESQQEAEAAQACAGCAASP